jgi:acylphosphatase
MPVVSKMGRMPPASEVYHESVHFSGHVQGVGFRYTVLHVAREYDVAGYAQNLPDGRVGVEVEGEKDEVGRFLTEIGERLHGFIRQVERTGGRRAAQFDGFHIR